MNDLPAIKIKLNQHLSTLQDWINDQLNISTKQQEAAVESAKENMQQSGSSGMGTALMGIANALVMLILLPIYTFLILYYRKLIHKFLLDVFTERHRSKVEDVLTESKTIVQGYMVGLLLEMAIVTGLNTAGFLVNRYSICSFPGCFCCSTEPDPLHRNAYRFCNLYGCYTYYFK